MNETIRTLVHELKAAGCDVEASTFAAGSKLLLVLEMPEWAERARAEAVQRMAASAADEFKKIGVDAVCFCVPPGFKLSAINITNEPEAPPGMRHVGTTVLGERVYGPVAR